MCKRTSILLALACSLGVARASAALCIVAREPSAVERVLVVENAADGNSALWVTIETRTEAGLVLLLEERRGETIESGGDAFVEALDAETAPFVADLEDPECRAPARPTPTRLRASAGPLLSIRNQARLEAALNGASLSACKLSLPVTVLTYAGTSSAARTSVVRVFGAEPGTVRTGFPATMTFLTFGPGRARWAGATELWARDLLLEYDLASGTSNYAQERERALRMAETRMGSASLIESVLAVFDPALAPPSLAATSLAGDVKLALSGQDPAQTWVTRSVTRTSAGASRELVFEHATAAERALVPVLVDSSGCRVPSFAPAPAPYLPPRESPAPVDDYGYSPDHGSAVYVTTDASCSGNSRSSDDDSCSGDSASSGDDSCSGDSSASSDDDSCSGDSGSSEDESCSGSSASTDDEDEACVNASARAPARGSSGRPRRTRVSVWTLALAATWLPIRRRRRPL